MNTEPQDAGNGTPDDIELLLPWYASGEVTAAERSRVENYVAANPEAARQLDLIREEIDSTIALNEALGAPSAGSLDMLMRDIRATGKTRGPATAGLWSRLAEWFSVAPPQAMGLAAIGAAIVIVVQGVVIGSLLIEPGGTRFETASAPPAATATGDADLLVGFSGDASAGAIVSLLDEIGGTVISGPEGNGLFEIRLEKRPASDEEIDKLVETLKQRGGIVRFVVASE